MRTLENRLEELIKERFDKPPTQDELASHLGISQPTISLWLRQKVRRFDDNTIVKMCEFFKCSVGDLLVIRDKSN